MKILQLVLAIAGALLVATIVLSIVVPMLTELAKALK